MSPQQDVPLLERVTLAHKAGEKKPLTTATLEEVFAFAYETGKFSDIPFARFHMSDLTYSPSDAIQQNLRASPTELMDKMGVVPFALISHMPNPQIDGNFLFLGDERGAMGLLYVNSIKTFLFDGTPLDRDYLSLASPRAFAPLPHVVESIGNVENGYVSFYTQDSDGSAWSIHVNR